MRNFALTTVLLSVCAAAFAAEVKLDGIKCPVSGKPVKADKFVDYKGGKVYFCCGGCPGAFEKDPAKFAAKANLQLVATGQAIQGACPLTGAKLNPETAIEVDGAKVAFCCNKCKAKAEAASGDDEVNMLFSDAAFEKAKFKIEKPSTN